MNTYRVDLNDKVNKVPCGMNSIRYVGDNIAAANKVFNTLKSGYDAWNKKDPSYGVTISKWDKEKRNYVVFNHKGLEVALSF
jgi:hypothetical protein